jgi:RimJ/RimL family protein N-acetyltransferase
MIIDSACEPGPAASDPGIGSSNQNPSASWPLVTSRLLISRLQEADVVAALALMADPAVRDWLRLGSFKPNPHRLLHGPYFASRLRCGDGLAGVLGLHPDHLSYAIAPALWGQGLGGEMVSAACDALAPAAGMHRLSARVQRDNLRSRRLLESAGFRFAGLVPTFERPAVAALQYDCQIPRRCAPTP